MEIIPTKVNNLIRDGKTDIYYARIKIRQKVFTRSLGRDAITKEIALLRLPDMLQQIRNSVPTSATGAPLNPKATFRDVYSVYKSAVENDADLAPSTKEFRLRPASLVERVWPRFFDKTLRSISHLEVNQMLQELKSGKHPYRPHRSKKKTVPGNSATVVNAFIGFFRRVFELGVTGGVLGQNPAIGLERKQSKKKLLRLPDKTQFATMITHIRTTAGRGRMAGDLVEGLVYSGMRVAESRRLRWMDLDFGRGMMTVYGTKTYESARIVPMTAAFRVLVEGMKKHRGDVQHEDRVFEVNEAAVSLARACTHVGVRKMTHQDLRHLYATTCIESGVDIPTVAGWLGHSDGGVLAMKTYGHVRPAHTTEAVKKVSFQ